MSHELDDKLKKLAASANYSPAGLKDLFEGWDIVDFMMVEAAIRQASDPAEWQQSLDTIPRDRHEDWMQSWEKRLLEAWEFSGFSDMRRAATVLRRLLLITQQSEFELIREAFRLPLELPEGRGVPEYLIGMDDKTELSRTVRNNIDKPERLFAVRDLARFDDKALVAAEEVKSCFPNASQVIDGLLAEMLRGFEFGNDTIKFRPTIILGEPGIGKTTVVRSLLGSLEMRPEIVSVAGHTDSQVFGVSAGWSSAMPSVMTNAVLRQKILNPVLVLDEIDKVRPSHNGDIYAELLLLTEPSDAKAYRDKFLSAATDCSRMSWLFTANDLTSIPPPLKKQVHHLQNGTTH
ncbi:AAA family ATPase [Rhodobacteraceae bacterium M382]|nr:AAA family ATPase [Rhodobacteraceae bacterium M382]